MSEPTYSDLSKDEKSCIVYFETCVVDHGGLVEAQRMNAADHEAAKKFSTLGWLEFYRIPACHLPEGSRLGAGKTHIVRFREGAWRVAHEGRRARAEPVGPFATKCIETLAEMGKLAAPPSHGAAQ